MKKFIILATLLVIFLLVFLAIIYISFYKVKPVTNEINNRVRQKLSETVFIPPKEIVKSSESFETTAYTWEMLTPQNEAVAIELIFTPSYLKENQQIATFLKMEERGDPSIFVKVFPALIKNTDLLRAASEAKDQNPNINQEVFNNLSLTINEAKQTIAIAWEFDKAEISPELSENYKKLEKYPSFLLKLFFAIPRFFVSILSAS